MQKNKIQDKIKQLEREIEEHNRRLQQAQFIARQEFEQIIAKQGALSSLRELLEEDNEKKEK